MAKIATQAGIYQILLTVIHNYPSTLQTRQKWMSNTDNFTIGTGSEGRGPLAFPGPLACWSNEGYLL